MSHLSLRGADLRGCGDGDPDGQAAVVGEVLGQRGVDDEAVPVGDDRVHALQDRPGRGLPLETPVVSVELQAIGEAVGLGGGPNQHHGGEELGVPCIPLLFPEHQQEVVAEAGVDDEPVGRRREVHVRGQEDDVSPLEDVHPVHLPQVGHHHLQAAFPLAGEQGAQAGHHPGGVQPRLRVVQVVGPGVVAEAVMGLVLAAVLAVVVGGEVRGVAAGLRGALSDGVSAGHIL